MLIYQRVTKVLTINEVGGRWRSLMILVADDDSWGFNQNYNILWMEETLHQSVTIGNYEIL